MLCKSKEKINYQFVPGDKIDKLFGDTVIKLYCPVQILRIKPGVYLFGTKQIICKIVNEKLLIRVGGGFMSVEEFIQ